MIKAILFDMDGVLIEAKDWHYEALNKALALFGYTITYSDHLANFDGLSTSTKLKKITLERGLPEELHSFINEMKQQYTIEYIFKRCRPNFTREYALSTLKSHGYKLACCSNSIAKTMNLMLSHARLEQYLDVKLSNQDVTKSKPNPEIYLKAMETLGLKPQECLIVEDNENGIKAAKASGAYLYKVAEVTDVTYNNLIREIELIEGR